MVARGATRSEGSGRDAKDPGFGVRRRGTAFEGLEALKDLHRDGDITVYATAVITKDANGVAAVKESNDRGPVGAAVGVVGGALVGLLAGPVGAAVGAYVGGIGGLAYDLFTVGVGSDFIGEASAQLTPGKSAVVADIDETWVTPVETRIGDLGGVTFRKVPDEVIDEQMTREATQAKAEIEGLRAEVRRNARAPPRREGGAADRPPAPRSSTRSTLGSKRRSTSSRPTSTPA